jgi:hypothetical protein
MLDGRVGDHDAFEPAIRIVDRDIAGVLCNRDDGVI